MYRSPKMSTLQGDLEHCPSPPHSSPSGSATPQEKSAGESSPYKMSTLQGDLEHCPSPHQSSPSGSPIAPEKSAVESSSYKMSTLQGDLEQRPSPQHSSSSDLAITQKKSSGWEEDLFHAICVNNRSVTKAILDQHPNALSNGIFGPGRTALHVAAQCGNITIVEMLVELVPPESLQTVDFEGFTALGMACWCNGNTPIARCLVNKNINVVTILNKHILPVTQAFGHDFKEMGRYLYSVTPRECFTPIQGSKLLRYCFQAQCFDIALDLLQQCEELLFVPNDIETKNDIETEIMPIHQIATLNTVILSPSELIWKRRIYNWHGLLPRFIRPIDNSVAINGGLKKTRDLELLRAQIDDLLLLVCKNARKALQNDYIVIAEAFRLAAKEGNAEFVLQVSKAIPEIFQSKLMVDCFFEALDFRQARVFTLIHGLRSKHGLVTSMLDDDKNTLIHKAAMKAPDHILNHIYAPTLQMQRELQWFKEAESLLPPSFRGLRNKNGLTAKELFRQSHAELMKEGEKWLKDTASSCSVVGTLIVTIMFATVFTVPGGNDQSLGYPLFIKQPFFKVFIFSTIISFLSSSISVLMFLAILTSQYSEENFLKSLPTKLIFGLSFLFMSIVSMITAFLSTTYLMLKHTNYSWGLLPVMILAIAPIFLFVRSEFPLLLHTYVSTYGNLFDRNVKPWP